MKNLLLIATLFFAGWIYGQDEALIDAIVAEGKALYQTEMASWHGTDLFLERFPAKRDQIGGYFSYADGDVTKCVFFDRQPTPAILAVIGFDSAFSTETATIDSLQASFSPTEQSLYEIRKVALAELQADTLFVTYKNTSLNLIPIIWNGTKKVYVVTGPKISGVVVFGNDYLITFDNDNHVQSKKTLHKNIIPINYSEEPGADNSAGAVHSHLPETGEYMTVTDICTLMLYAKYANWNQHMVISKHYINIWNCNANTLVVITRKAFEKIAKDQEKRGKKHPKKE